MAYNRDTQEWAWSWDRCWKCGKRSDWGKDLFIHHFVRGTSKKENDLKTTIMLCGRCHDAEHNLPDCLRLIGCLRLKKRIDPEHYDLAHVCKVRGRASTSITEEEVDADV
jgi:hypothetical protein